MNEAIDLQSAAQAWQVLDDMRYRVFQRVRAERPDKPLSYFEPLGYSPDLLEHFERRFQQGAA